MVKTTNRIINKLAVTLLVLIMVVGVLPTEALAAKASQPDWYFLFAIFKSVDAGCKDANGKTTHQKYTMTQDEINYFKENARDFEAYMNSTGVMLAHVDVLVIDTPVTELKEYSGGSYLGAEHVKPLLEGKVELDRYDHVSCIVSLNTYTRYGGISSSAFENGTGISCMNFINWGYCQNSIIPREKKFPIQVYVHEFLHFLEQQNKKFGAEFDLHRNVENLYKSRDDNREACYTDVILNRVEGNAETGTGVHSAAWQYPPHMLWTIDELTIPDGVTGIGARAFQYKSNLKRVTISDSVTSIGKYAFYQSELESVNIPKSMTSIEANAFCGASSLKSVTIPSSVTSIGGSAFNGCSSLKSVTIPSRVTSLEAWTFANCNGLESASIPASVTSIGDVAFYGCNNLQDIYYGGTETQWKAIKIGTGNAALTRAKIHYNSGATDTYAYLCAVGEEAYILPEKYTPLKSRAAAYLFTDMELTALFSAIDQLPPTKKEPFLNEMAPTLYRLIYTCGLRPNEGRELLAENINFETGEILITHTKRNKERFVVMSDDMLALARRYEQRRRIFCYYSRIRT